MFLISIYQKYERYLYASHHQIKKKEKKGYLISLSLSLPLSYPTMNKEKDHYYPQQASMCKNEAGIIFCTEIPFVVQSVSVLPSHIFFWLFFF